MSSYFNIANIHQSLNAFARSSHKNSEAKASQHRALRAASYLDYAVGCGAPALAARRVFTPFTGDLLKPAANGPPAGALNYATAFTLGLASAPLALVGGASAAFLGAVVGARHHAASKARAWAPVGVVVGLIPALAIAAVIDYCLGAISLLAKGAAASVDALVKWTQMRKPPASHIPDLVVPTSVQEALQAALPTIFSDEKARQSHAELDVLADNTNFIFRLKSAPGFVFKMARPEMNNSTRICDRLANMRRAQKVIAQHNLDLLYIPPARIINTEHEGRRVTVLVEQAVDIDPNITVQEELYRRHDAHLGPTFAQLAFFIAKTEFADVEFRNIPLMGVHANGVAQGHEPPYRVALIDLEHLGGGVLTSRGLIRCATPRHFDAIEKATKQAGGRLNPVELEEAKIARVAELEGDAKLLQFYERTGCLADPGKHVPTLTAEELGLPEYAAKEPEYRITLTFQELIRLVTQEINRQLDDGASLPKSAAKQRRYVRLPITHGALYAMDFNEISFDQARHVSDETYENGYAITKVLNAMVAKGLIFESKKTGHGYFVQV